MAMAAVVEAGPGGVDGADGILARHAETIRRWPRRWLRIALLTGRETRRDRDLF
jgi:hypothetical protein